VQPGTGVGRGTAIKEREKGGRARELKNGVA